MSFALPVTHGVALTESRKQEASGGDVRPFESIEGQIADHRPANAKCAEQELRPNSRKTDLTPL
jgi:hypothetical protein